MSWILETCRCGLNGGDTRAEFATLTRLLDAAYVLAQGDSAILAIHSPDGRHMDFGIRPNSDFNPIRVARFFERIPA